MKAMIGVIVLSVALTFLILGVANYVHRDEIKACEELNGEIIFRGYNCILPSGEIVDPVKYLEG